MTNTGNDAPQENFISRLAANRFLPLVFLFVVLALVVGVRVRLADRPLERDEGEYAYAGQLLLKGIPPYQAAYNMKWPGTYVSYAIIMALFGRTTAAIHFGLILITVTTAGVVCLVGKRMLGVWGGAVAAASFALLSISPATFGLSTHATHFVVFFALLGVYALQNVAGHRSRLCLFVAGALFGVATIMKQSGAAFVVFGLFWIMVSAKIDGQWSQGVLRCGWLIAGTVAPMTVMFGAILWAGVWPMFWHWTFEYAHSYATLTSFSQAAQNLSDSLGALARTDGGLLGVAAIGGIMLFSSSVERRWKTFI
ncbi:MAG TPA: glycosyltransferase family 39 protein, partial [Verrucomicrobiae bacterium]|nr:glycosyltransferase family 39 protein [Verrucomicrobiae bacterium]